MASRSLRRARRRVESSVVGEGEDEAGEPPGFNLGELVGVPFGDVPGWVGDFEAGVEGEGAAGLRGRERDAGGFLAASPEELIGRDEKAASRSFECTAQNCIYRATILL